MGLSPNTDASSNRKAVVLTAIPVEFNAVCAHLRDCQEEPHENGNIYQRGRLEADDGTWDVLVVQTGASNQQAAWQTERALHHFQPSVALFVGVAGGLKDVAVGDVVAATKVYGYESGKASTSFESRPEVGRSSHALERRANAEANTGRWRARIIGNVPRRPPCAIVGPIASGEKIVADTRSALHEMLRKQFSDALAVEMEGLGFLNAAHAHPNLQALVVRGISDCIDGKAEADASGSQEQAARHASAFAFEVLARFAASKVSTVSGPQPAAPVPQAPPERTEKPGFINLRTVVVVLLLGALGFLALGMLGRSPRPSRGSWTREPHMGGREDWHRSSPSR